jgi:hypothetical protein
MIVALLFWHYQKQQPATTEPIQNAVQLTNAPTAIASVTSQSVPRFVQQPVSSTTNQKPATQNDHDKLPELFQKFNEQHNLPIEFYGQVIDQDSNSVSGVKIDVAISQTYMESPTNLAFIPKTFHVKKETGTDGRFEIDDEKGEGVDIESIQKSGYELEPNTKRNYGTSGSSFENPIIFKIWSTNIHEQLITGERKFQIVPDGRAYFIDLTKGTIAESGVGDLKVWVKRPDQITYGMRYDWSSEIDAVSGGLLEETDTSSSMYSAPADGYTPMFQFEQKIGSGWGDSTGTKHFYVMLHNGQEYGRISIELYAYYDDHTPGLIRLQYAINPSGSRILH